jgi:FkbM family methyltransferase
VKEKSGWWLPDGDTYFSRFLEGSLKNVKKNGFQREHLEAALKHVKKFDTAVDVGAHCGFWAWDMANQFKKVYAFEPAPDCYECLVKNLAEHTHAIISNVAIGDKDGECQLIDDPKRIQATGANTGARYVLPAGHGTPMITLDSLRLDDGVDFLKVDVEGFEFQVLKGAHKLIRRFHPVISMETGKRFAGPRYGISNFAAHRFLLEKFGYCVVESMRPDTVYA